MRLDHTGRKGSCQLSVVSCQSAQDGTTILQGTVHLVLFATFLFLAVVP